MIGHMVRSASALCVTRLVAGIDGRMGATVARFVTCVGSAGGTIITIDGGIYTCITFCDGAIARSLGAGFAVCALDGLQGTAGVGIAGGFGTGIVIIATDHGFGGTRPA